MPGWFVPAAIAGAGIVSSLFSSKSQSDAASDAADAELRGLMEQLGFAKEQWEYMKQINEPYMKAGAYALPQITGPDQMTDINSTVNRLAALRNPLYGTGSRPVTQSPYPMVGDQFRADPSFRESTFNPPAPAAPERKWIPEQYERKFIPGTRADPARRERQLVPGTGVWEEQAPGPGAPPGQNALADRTRTGPPGAQPIQLHNKLAKATTENQLQLSYQPIPGQGQPIVPEILKDDQVDPFTQPLDEASPYYTWQQEQGEKALNRAMFARGKYDSSTAINALSDFNRALGAEETERQYGRRQDAYGRRVEDYMRNYGRIMDEYGLKNQGYNRLMDLLRIGQSATGQQQLSAGTASGQIGSTYAAMGRAGAGGKLGEGEAWGQFWGGMGGVPQNALSQYYLMQALQRPQQPQYGSTVPTNPNQLPYMNY